MAKSIRCSGCGERFTVDDGSKAICPACGKAFKRKTRSRTKGCIEAYDAETGDQAFRIVNDFKGPHLLSPDRAWMVGNVLDQYLEVHDTTNGKLLGRFGGAGPWALNAISPDGKLLVALGRFASYGQPRNHVATVFVWDMTSGEELMSLDLHGVWGHGPAVWINKDEFILGRTDKNTTTPEPHVIHIPSKSIRAKLACRGSPVRNRPDTRLWWYLDAGVYFTASMTDLAFPTGGLAPGNTVGIEVEAGLAKFQRPLQTAVTQRVRDYGFTPGKGEWRFRAIASAEDTDDALTGGINTKVHIPAVKGEIQLVAPDKSVVWRQELAGRFVPDRTSKFYSKKRTNLTDPTIERGGSKTYFEFKGNNPHAAMTEEAFERCIAQLNKTQLPQHGSNVDGEYRSEIPVITLKPPAGVIESGKVAPRRRGRRNRRFRAQ